MEKKPDSRKQDETESSNIGPEPYRPFRDSKAQSEKFRNLSEKIIAAKNLDGILIDLKDDITDFFECERITVYIIDGMKVELVSRFMSKSEIAEIRLPISKSSIAGYTALTQKIVTLRDVKDENELTIFDPDLKFDKNWDKITGFTTKQVLAVPMIVRKYLMGVMQLMNRKDRFFDKEDEDKAKDLARIIGVALYNQKRTAKLSNSKFSYLFHKKMLSPKELHMAVSDAAKVKQPLENYLIEKKGIPKKDVGVSLGNYYGVPFVEYSADFQVPEAILKGVKASFMRNNLWVPLRLENNKIVIAVDDPQNFRKLDEIKSIYPNKRLEFCVALRDDILDFITLFTERTNLRAMFESESVDDLLKETEADADEDVDEFIELGEEKETTVAVLVNRIILDAHGKGATDIHIEPGLGKNKTMIRFRIDGRCVPYLAIGHNIRNEIISRIKIMANLDMMVHKKPQLGRIKFQKHGKQDIDLRVAVIPTHEGFEAAAMKIFASYAPVPIDRIGMSDRTREKYIRAISRPYGLVIVTGPGGSGKNATLHSTLSYLNGPHIKIWTIEDVVEIVQDGITQIEVDPESGLDYHDAVKAVMLADPDVLMINDIKDGTTAKMATNAALTGTLVLVGIHADSAAAALTTLLEMGVNARKLSNAFLCSLGQRLVRVLCDDCKMAKRPTQEAYDDLVQEYGAKPFENNLNVAYDDTLKISGAIGCKVCNKTGYRGRMAIFEFLDGSDELKRMLKMKLGTDDLLWQSIREGMTTLKQEGVQKIFEGKTDVDEVNRLGIE